MLYKEEYQIVKGCNMNFMTTDEMNALCEGRYVGDPFSVLGMHLCSKNILTPFLFVRTFQPQAKKVELVRRKNHHVHEMKKIHPNGLFEMAFPDETEFFEYYLINI